MFSSIPLGSIHAIQHRLKAPSSLEASMPAVFGCKCMSGIFAVHLCSRFPTPTHNPGLSSLIIPTQSSGLCGGLCCEEILEVRWGGCKLWIARGGLAHKVSVTGKACISDDGGSLRVGKSFDTGDDGAPVSSEVMHAVTSLRRSDSAQESLVVLLSVGGGPRIGNNDDSIRWESQRGDARAYPHASMAARNQVMDGSWDDVKDK